MTKKSGLGWGKIDVRRSCFALSVLAGILSVQTHHAAASDSRLNSISPIRKHIDARIPGRFLQPRYVDAIANGNFVWSQKFPTRNAGLFGYASRLYDGLIAKCPDHFSASDRTRKELFLGMWFSSGEGTNNPVRAIKSLLTTGAATTVLRNAALKDTARLLVGTGRGKRINCKNRMLRDFSRNVAKLLSAGRPVSGPGVKNTTLKVEKTAKVHGRHAYLKDIRRLSTPGSMQLQRDIRQSAAQGLSVLECHYDSKPSDKYYEVQYYWAVGALTYTGFLVPNIAHAFLTSSQKRLVRANGSANVRHPFLSYGSPRFECPAHRDPDLPMKQIYAPRGETAGVTPGTPVGDPKVTRRSGRVTFDYGAVPEAFVPPVSESLGNGIYSVRVMMEKQRTGSLVGIKLNKFGWYSINKSELDYRRHAPHLAKRLFEDVVGAARKGGAVLECHYLSKRHGIVSFHRYWYKSRPDIAEPALLKSRIPDHPMLIIKPPQEGCPPTRSAALKVQNVFRKLSEIPPVTRPVIEKPGQKKPRKVARRDTNRTPRSRSAAKSQPQHCKRFAADYRQRSKPITCHCTIHSLFSPAIYGTGVYTSDSGVCPAARHAGKVGRRGGTVTFRFLAGRSRYVGSKANGIRSRSYNRKWRASFAFD